MTLDLMVKTLALSVAAFALTHFQIDVTDSLSLILGTIPALLALRLLGLGPALVVTTAASLYTALQWGHPYGLLTAPTEIIAIHLLRERIDNLAIADLIYWVCGGGILVAGVFIYVLGVDVDTAVIFSLKQSINNIFNATIASLILIFVGTRGWSFGTSRPPIAFNSVLFTVLLFVVIASSATMFVVSGRGAAERAEERVRTVMALIAGLTAQEVRSSSQLTENVDRNILPEEAGAQTARDIISTLMKLTPDILTEDDVSFAALGPDGELLMSYGRVASLGGRGPVVTDAAGAQTWRPGGDMIALHRIRDSQLVLRTTFDSALAGQNVTVIVETRNAAVLARLSKQERDNMVWLMIVMLASIVIAHVLSRWLSRPLMTIADAGHRLSMSIANPCIAAPRLPPSRITEYEILGQTFNDVVDALQTRFIALATLQENLEGEVQKRTSELYLMSEVARQASSAIVITDRQGSVVWANGSFERMSGKNHQDLLGMNSNQIPLDKNTDPATVTMMRRAIRTRKPFNADLRIHLAYGQPRWITLRSAPMYDQDKGFIGFLSIADDITAQKETKIELRQSFAREQLATDIAQLGIWDIDTKTGRAFSNTRNSTIYGISSDAPEGIIQAWENVLHPDDKAVVLQTIELLRSDNLSDADLITRIEHPTLGVRYVQLGARVERDASGVAQTITGVTRDVTDAHLYARKLVEAAEHTQAIIDNVLDSIVTTDASGRITEFNPASEEIFGYCAEEIIGQHVSVLLPPDSAWHLNAYMKDLQSGATDSLLTRKREMKGLRKNGEIFSVEISVAQLGYGPANGYVGSIRDITDRKRIDLMQSEFIATLSHELRTPLTSINGVLGLLQAGAAGQLSDKAVRLVDNGLRNSSRLARLIEDLLDFERLMAGRLLMSFERHRTIGLLTAAVEDNAYFAASHSVSIRLESLSPEAIICVDEVRFLQVMTNLLSNAVKFSPKGTEVVVEAVVDGEDVVCTVTDSGPGIPKAFLDQLFKKFSQVDASDTRNTSGTGLGLAISRKLVSNMYGTIGYAESPGEGAQFWIRFPRTDIYYGSNASGSKAQTT